MMWDTIKRNISNIGQITLTGLFCLAVFILVLIHVFGLNSDDIKKLFASNSKKPESQVKKPALNPKSKSQPKTKPKLKTTKKVVGNEVRQYSEFVTVNHPSLSLNITTGIRYDNSTNQKVVSQWCYAQKTKAKNDGFSVKMSIRHLDGSKTKNFAPYSVQTLREFGLTQVQAKDLITYCRFK